MNKKNLVCHLVLASHLCSSLRKQKNPFDVSINIKVIVIKKIASMDQRSKKEQF